MLSRGIFIITIRVTLLGALGLGLGACGGDDEDARDMSHCAATTCTSAQVFNAKTCQCDAIDMANADQTTDTLAGLAALVDRMLVEKATAESVT